MKIAKAIIEKVNNLREPKTRLNLFAIRPQIEFFTKYINSFLGLRSLLRNNPGKFVDYQSHLRADYGIDIAGFYSSTPLPKKVIANVLIARIPRYLLNLSTVRTIRLMDNNFLDIPKRTDGTLDFNQAKLVEVDIKNLATWPKDYIPACTKNITGNSKLPFVDFHSEIQLWPLDGYTHNCCVRMLYELYCLLHEFAHTIFYSFQYGQNALKQTIKWGEKCLTLNKFFVQWAKICQEEILPASFYGGYYAPDILDWTFNKSNISREAFYRAIDEEFAECFTGYIMGFMENLWGKTGQLADFDLGTGAPSKKYKTIELLLKGRVV